MDKRRLFVFGGIGASALVIVILLFTTLGSGRLAGVWQAHHNNNIHILELRRDGTGFFTILEHGVFMIDTQHFNWTTSRGMIHFSSIDGRHSSFHGYHPFNRSGSTLEIRSDSFRRINYTFRRAR